ncbi:putative spermidine/putrescine transport system substrate-binding protein [Rhizobium sp. NFR07]|jgi:putative spermidine/putrescine transport system substrate-binding protein|uniref:extracellular solute-binding protein n=1 Tax=Rhizobium sp. NFR07 TaxID=1566262 RepID=UPI0008EAB996|nr:extracellular solute-binding protein [Rhizobium sp. NFR07]SFB31351.1 putative spermidine/putrescine transport system substrate-binding protein [Rhizobium sp. NFR07]
MSRACLALLGALFVQAGAAAPVHAADLTVGAFGGVWEEALRSCIVAPFEKQTGKTVDVVLGAPLQWLNQIAANPDAPPFDVVFAPTETAYQMIDKGLVLPFSGQPVAGLADIYPDMVSFAEGYGVVFTYGAMGVIYNSRTVKVPIRTWDDFYDAVERGEITAAIPSIHYPGSLGSSLWNVTRVSGGDERNAQPGLDRVKRMMAGGSLEFWADHNQVLNALGSGEIDAAMYWDGRSRAFIIDGNNPDFEYVTPSPGGPATFNWIQVVKKADPSAWTFVTIALGAEGQSCFASKTHYGSVNMKAVFDPAVKGALTRHEDLSIPSFREINRSRQAWLEAWNKQIGR